MTSGKTPLDHLSPEQKQAYKVISRGLHLDKANKEQQADYQRFLDHVERSAIQHGNTDLITLIGIFRKWVMYPILVIEANFPEAYKPLLSLVTATKGEQPIRDGAVGQADKNSGLPGSSTTIAPPPKLKKKNFSK